MPMYFDDVPHNEHRALQIWQVLIGYAAARRTLTYSQLAEIMGWGNVKPLARPLGHIMYWCRANELPALTVLVVNMNSGQPGDGLALDGDTDKEREKVFRYAWFRLFPPSPEQLEAAWDTKGVPELDED